MPDGWTSCTLGDFIELKRGYDLPQAERRAGSVPVVSSSGVSGTHDEAKVQPPGVVTGRYGTLGEVHFINEPFWPLNTTLYVRDFKGNDARFVAYFLKLMDFGGSNDKSSVPGLNRNHLHRYEITVPLPDEQRAIAGLLGALDDKIEQNRRTAAKLEALARATFRAWFVDFAPVRAKAAAQRTYPGLSPAAFAALPDRLTDSRLGPIPAGWEVGPISTLAQLSTEQVNPLDHPEEVFDHFSIPAFDAGEGPVREAGDSIKSGKLLVPPGCVMISKLNPRIPRIWLPVATEGVRPIASTEFIVLVPNAEYHRSFLAGLISQEAFLNELTGQATGTSNSHQRIKPKAFMATDVVLPPVGLRKAYDEMVAPILELIQQGRNESRHLAALRDYLLPRLLSGVVRVRDAVQQGGEHDANN